ncbi:MAG: hypothetical protein QOJ57_38, partial [Thermoleophilaceae bacterium]|nr:hypothetical protein [Thermoleophilaceae bacterium]
MTAVAPERTAIDWSSENQRLLVGELARVRRLLERHAGQDGHAGRVGPDGRVGQDGHVGSDEAGDGTSA